MRFGTVALVGRSNVGKSTFLNAALGEPLAIVSALPQTTRDALLGVVNRSDAQIAFLDTPGLHRPRSELGRRMNAAAVDAARSADVVMLMTDVPERRDPRWPRSAVERDRAVLELVPKDHPTLLVINKVDLVHDKSKLLPLMTDFQAALPGAEIVPISVRQDGSVDRVLAALAKLLPEGPAGYPEDTLTNRSTAFFVREYVREQVLAQAAREVPHAVAVTIDAIETGPKVMIAKATLHVEKEGQLRILVGRGGERIRDIGIAARERIEQLLGQKLHLELFVRVSPRWKNVPRQLAELGYDTPADAEADAKLPVARGARRVRRK